MQNVVPHRTRFEFAAAFCLLLLYGAQLDAQATLSDREPFDQVILKPASGGDILDVFPLALPRQPLASLPTEGRLSLRLLDRPDDVFEVAWTNVAEVRLYEQMLLNEARRLAAAGQFDEAYDCFARLLVNYPGFPNVDDSVNAFLRQNALALHQSQQNERALALLMTLGERNPADPGLPNAVEVVAGEIIQQHLRSQNYAAARAVLDLWQSKFRNVATAAAAAWQSRFEAAADRQLGDARRLVDEKKFIEARQSAERAVAIWPTHQPAAELLARIQRESPSVLVGVFEGSPRAPSQRMDDWAALRARPLVERLLVEQVGFGAEGGEYRSPWGELRPDDSGLSLRFQLAARDLPASDSNLTATFGQLSADQLARHFLAMAEPGSPSFRADFSDLIAGVSIGAGNSVELHWKRPHVRPESLLQVSPPAASPLAPPESKPRPAAPFTLGDFQTGKVTFAAAPTSGETISQSAPDDGRLQAIVEQTMPDDDSAVAALLAGQIDMLDRVPPWHIASLRAAPGIRLVPYRLPTVHVLIPNSSRALAAKREFRRGLCYGIDRRWIVERVLQGGASQAGFEVVSGPFPAGTSLSDPIRYAYNNQVAPRPFEPRLAAILMTVAWAGVQKEAGVEEGDGALANLPQLVLAHPADPLARVACQSIQAQLEREGVPVELREFSADELLAGRVECDFRYAELAIWEPVTDARRIMGPGGLAGDSPSPYVLAALRRLDEATNWRDVRAAMSEIHQIAHQELPVIPLWQTVNYFAYREVVAGIGEAPMTLYQNVDDWRLSQGGTVATRDGR